MTNQVKTYANHKFRFRLNECIRRCEKMIEFRRRNTPNPKRPSEWSECSPNEHQKKNVIRKRWLFQAILSFTCVEYPNREASERIVQRIMLLISVLKISSRAPSRRRIQSRIQKKKTKPAQSIYISAFDALSTHETCNRTPNKWFMIFKSRRVHIVIIIIGITSIWIYWIFDGGNRAAASQQFAFNE